MLTVYYGVSVSSTTRTVTARLPAALAAEIDRTAAEDARSRTGQIVWLARHGLAGRERLAELERIANSARTAKEQK